MSEFSSGQSLLTAWHWCRSGLVSCSLWCLLSSVTLAQNFNFDPTGAAATASADAAGANAGGFPADPSAGSDEPVTQLASLPAAADAASGSSTAEPTDGAAVDADAADGDAEPAKGSLFSSVWQLFVDGGLLMLPILGCSVVLLIFVFERAFSLRISRVIPKPFVTRILHQLEEDQLDAAEALQLCERDGSVIAQVFAAAVKKWNRPSVEVEQAIMDAGEREAYSLRKYLRLFNGISNLAPLLGLLGTVVGMIECFGDISNSNAMGRPELLAGGIGKALLTTAGGLFVAIPALTAYLYFTSRVDRIVVEIDRLGQQLVAAVASDGWKDKSKGETRPRKPAKAA